MVPDSLTVVSSTYLPKHTAACPRRPRSLSTGFYDRGHHFYFGLIMKLNLMSEKNAVGNCVLDYNMEYNLSSPI
jgi:hypothetical protein